MLPETSEPKTTLDNAPDLFAEPRDCANLWDVTALWPEVTPKSTQEEKTPKTE